MQPSKIYTVENVTFSYPGYPPSLVDISFSIDPGESVALVGANGSGKTTLLQLLDGLYFPASGRISFRGCELTEDALERTELGKKFRHEVGFVFQNPDVMLFSPTIEEELAFGPLQIGLQKDEIMKRVDDVLELMQINPLRGRTPQSLSTGEQKRVALGCLLVMNPSVLLLDEPMAGLDLRSRTLLMDILKQLKNAGLTLIMATHDLALAMELCERALVLSEDHRLLVDGEISEIIGDAAFLSTANLVNPLS